MEKTCFWNHQPVKDRWNSEGNMTTEASLHFPNSLNSLPEIYIRGNLDINSRYKALQPEGCEARAPEGTTKF